MTNDTTTLSGSLDEMKDQLITELDGKGVTATFDSTTGLLGLVSKIGDIQTGGSGATNIAQGTFTTGDTGGTTGTVTLDYSGNGYPIAVLIWVNGGLYNPNTAWYTDIAQHDAGLVIMVKAETTTTPTYTSSGTNNYGTISYVYKSSTSSATSYGRSGSNTVNIYSTSSNNATAGNTMIRFKGNGTTLSYYIGNRSSSYRGLARDTTFNYIIVYSE